MTVNIKKLTINASTDKISNLYNKLIVTDAFLATSNFSNLVDNTIRSVWWFGFSKRIFLLKHVKIQIDILWSESFSLYQKFYTLFAFLNATNIIASDFSRIRIVQLCYERLLSVCGQISTTVGLLETYLPTSLKKKIHVNTHLKARNRNKCDLSISSQLQYTYIRMTFRVAYDLPCGKDVWLLEPYNFQLSTIQLSSTGDDEGIQGDFGSFEARVNRTIPEHIYIRNVQKQRRSTATRAIEFSSKFMMVICIIRI